MPSRFLIRKSCRPFLADSFNPSWSKCKIIHQPEKFGFGHLGIPLLTVTVLTVTNHPSALTLRLKALHQIDDRHHIIVARSKHRDVLCRGKSGGTTRSQHQCWLDNMAGHQISLSLINSSFRWTVYSSSPRWYGDTPFKDPIGYMHILMPLVLHCSILLYRPTIIMMITPSLWLYMTFWQE